MVLSKIQFGSPEAEIVSGFDDSTDCGDGSVCTTCEPGDDPNDNDPIEDDELCPLVEIEVTYKMYRANPLILFFWRVKAR